MLYYPLCADGKQLSVLFTCICQQLATSQATKGFGLHTANTGPLGEQQVGSASVVRRHLRGAAHELVQVTRDDGQDGAARRPQLHIARAQFGAHNVCLFGSRGCTGPSQLDSIAGHAAWPPDWRLRTQYVFAGSRTGSQGAAATHTRDDTCLMCTRTPAISVGTEART